MTYVKELMAIAFMVSLSGFAQEELCGEPSFSVEKAVCKAWYNRGEELSSGWRLEIKVGDWDESVVLEEAYFRNGKAKLRFESRKGAQWLVADFENAQKADETPVVDLKTDEAVLSYEMNGHKRQCKIKDIESEKPSFHQAMGDGKERE